MNRIILVVALVLTFAAGYRFAMAQYPRDARPCNAH